VWDQGVRKLAQREEDREQPGVVAIPKLARKVGKARGDDERTEPVGRPLHPRDKAREDERPPDRHLRDRVLVRGVQVVHLDVVGVDAESDGAS
jgi:hypothetical protein